MVHTCEGGRDGGRVYLYSLNDQLRAGPDL